MHATLLLPCPLNAGSPRRRLVTLVQEWLNFHHYYLKIDGVYGPVTAAVVQQFQQQHHLTITGMVDKDTFRVLVAPLARIVQATINESMPLHQGVLQIAQLHLSVRPREIGGPNMGPWVRLYMNGRQGKEYAWATGFVNTCIQQACDQLLLDFPFKKAYSCHVPGIWAQESKKLISGKSSDLRAVRPGHLFLVKRGSSHWIHTGIVSKMKTTYCETIEGNAVDEGHCAGTAVTMRQRAFTNLDFVLYD